MALKRQVVVIKPKGEKAMRSFRKPIRTKKVCHRLTAVFCVPLLALSPLITAGDTISVQRGETLDITTATTATAMDVHGTLNVQGILATPAEIKVDPKSTAVSLGTDNGDNAVINIGDYGRIEGGQYAIGGANGVGGFVIGGKRKDNATSYGYLKAHLASGQITLSADATSNSSVIDILTLNEGAYAGIKEKNWSGSFQGIVNRSTQADARVLFNGGVLVFFSSVGSYVFFSSHSSNATYADIIPQGEGGKAIVLEGVNGNPVEIHVAGGTSSSYLTNGTYPIQGKACFRGSGDVILHGPSTDQPGKWAFSYTADDVWAQNGDLKLTGTMAMSLRANNCLPRASTNGIVQVLGNRFCHLDLFGKTNTVNGLVVSGEATLTNSVAGVSQLVLGSVVRDGVFSVARVGGGPIEMVKRGTGTLTVTNTPSFPSMRVEAGTVLFKDDDCALGSLDANSASSITVDGCTLSPVAADVSGAKIQVNRGATLDGSGIAGGLSISNLTVDCSIGGGSFANIRPAQNGVLNLTGIVGEQPGRYVASETISSVVDGANLASWRVAVDGVVVRGSSVTIDNGNLVAHLTSGLIIVVK